MEREKLTSIWFALNFLEFVVNYGDFICVAYILYVGLVKILNLQLGYKFS